MLSGMDPLGPDIGTPIRRGGRLSRAPRPEAISPKRRTADSSLERRMCPTHVCLRAHSILECDCHGRFSMQRPTLATSFPGCPWPPALPPPHTYRPPSRLTSLLPQPLHTALGSAIVWLDALKQNTQSLCSTGKQNEGRHLPRDGERVIVQNGLVEIQNPLAICKKSCCRKLLDPGPILCSSGRSVLFNLLARNPKMLGWAKRQGCPLPGPSPLNLI